MADHSHLTKEQLTVVLTRIAGCCAALESVLGQAIESSDQETANLIDAGKMLAAYIGGMADNAVRPGGEVLGDYDRWNYGPHFKDPAVLQIP